VAALPASPEEPDGTEACMWLSDEEQTAWRMLLAVNARLLSRLDAELQAAHAISLHDYEVLVHLSESDNCALRMAELADRLVVSPSGLTRRLDGLVREGLVERKACISDRRGMLAVLSPAGHAVVKEAAPTHLMGVRRYVFDSLDRKQLRQMTTGLQAISASLTTSKRQTRIGNSP